MRAVVHDRYGPPEVLRVADVERPVPADDEVLVRVHASTVTRGDAMGVRSAEYRFTRVFTGIRRPRRTSSGTEFAGRVEGVGSAVQEFRVGDEVFGVGSGANAEYVAVRESGVIAPKPTNLTFEEAAAVPDGSLLALSCLRPAEPLAGKRVLVYGAAGSIGTAAVQLLLHHFEAEVTAVCDTKDVERVRSLGRGRRPRPAPRRLHDRRSDVRPDLRRGRQALVPPLPALARRRAGRTSRWISGSCTTCPLLALVTRFVGSRRAKLGIGRYRKDDLLLVRELVETGTYRPVIDRTYALDEVVEATRYVESGQKTGNVVLRVTDTRAQGFSNS